MSDFFYADTQVLQLIYKLCYSKYLSGQLIQKKCPVLILRDITLNNCQEQVEKHTPEAKYIPDIAKGALPMRSEVQTQSI